jgi:hypothetical protein
VDIDLARPRFRAEPRIDLAADSSHLDKNPDGVGIFDVPTTNKHLTRPQKVDFTVGAKAYRKKRLANNLYSYTCKALLVFAFFGVILVSAGLAINHKYQGRALPLTYVGDVSIGGMTRSQIKHILDNRYDSMLITFTDGGLVRKASLKQLGITVDTNSLAEQAVPKRVNPFSYLNWQRLETPVAVNERIVAGYMQAKFNSSKTKSEDAQLIIEKSKLKVNGELAGFQTDPKNIVQQIKYSLARASEPSINVNVVTIKPRVAAADLVDDFTRANTLLQTPVSIKYGYTTIKPTLQQKVAWLQLSQAPGSKYVNVDFSKGLVRSYIVDQVKKMRSYQIAKTSADGGTNADQTNQNDFSIDNIDEVTTAVVNSLKTGIPLDQKLSVRSIDTKNIASDQQTENALASAQ